VPAYGVSERSGETGNPLVQKQRRSVGLPAQSAASASFAESGMTQPRPVRRNGRGFGQKRAVR
jgi:hypothetical protein